MAIVSEIKLGRLNVPLYRYGWQSGERQPYKKTYNLLPGQSWWDAETTESQWEHYALQEDGKQIPVGALIAKELNREGASFSAFTEMWAGKFVMIDSNLDCVTPPKEIEEIIKAIKEVNSGKLGGFPDVFGLCADGTIFFREAKNVAAKDKLSKKQHDFADLLRDLFGQKADLGVVEWGIPVDS